MWNNKKLSKALNVEINQGINCNQIVIDSRIIKKKEIFLALKGENFDGHDFIEQAKNNGAEAAIVSKINKNISIPQILVSDTYEALINLAKYRRKVSNSIFIAITGSVGKTSYKEALSLILNEYGVTYKTSGNFNNHIGLPLCLANLDLNAKYSVFELAMNHSGEIKFLSDILNPDLALITKITDAHLGNFANRNGIISAKAEICSGFNENSMIILNQNDENYPKLREHIINKYNLKNENIKNFGSSEDNDLIIEEIDFKENKLFANINLEDKKYQIDFSIYNKAVAEVISSILLILRELNLDPEKGISAFKNFKSLEGRGEISKINIENKKITLINDSYNANYLSMRAALETLNFVASKNNNRKIAIIGDMLELGPDSAKFHLALKDVIIENKIDKIIAVGKFMQKLYNELPDNMKLLSYETIPTDINFIISSLKNDDVILVKSSNGIKTSIIARKLQEENNAL